MSEKRLAKDLKQGDVISLGGHYGPGDDIVKSVIKCPEGVIIYTERGGKFSVSENTTFDFVGSERRGVMSDDLERLRADLKAMDRVQGLWLFSENFRNEFHRQKDKIAKEIAALEAAAAPWREAKKSIDHWRSCGMWPDITGLFDHLTAENARLKNRVAELEAVASDVTALLEMTDEASDPSTDSYVAVMTANAALADMVPPFEGPIVGLEPILDPARVLATAEIALRARKWPETAHQIRAIWRGIDRNAKPYRLKGTDK